MFEKIRRWIQFNRRYLGSPPWDTGISPPELKTYINSAVPGRALDVGCGTGTNLITMAEAGWEVIGLEISLLSVLRARKKLAKAGISAHVICTDITNNIDFSEPFNLILDIGCYHSLSKMGRTNYHKNLRKWLSVDGIFLLYAHKQISPAHSHGISSQDLLAFQNYMDLEWHEETRERRPDGGGGKPSTWAKFVKSE